MHFMIGGVGDFYRKEGAGTDMQGHRDTTDTGGIERGEETLREMQPCGRGSDRAVLCGEDGLIIAAVVRIIRPLDIGRQWHMAVSRQCRLEPSALPAEFERHVAFCVFAGNSGPKIIAKVDAVALLEFFGAFRQCTPPAATQITMQR